MRIKFIPLLIAISFQLILYSSANCQDSLHKENYIQILKQKKSGLKPNRSIHTGRKVKVEYVKAGMITKVKGRILEIKDSAIVVKNKKAISDPAKMDTSIIGTAISINSIKTLSVRNTIPALSFFSGGVIFTTPGLMIISAHSAEGYGTSAAFYMMIGTSLAIDGVLLLTTGILIYTFNWKKYDINKKWAILVKK